MMTSEEFDNAVANWKKHFVEDARSDLKEALAQVEALKAENARLRLAMEDVERNTPTIEPTKPTTFDYNAHWAFWVAGNKLREALQPAPEEVK